LNYKHKYNGFSYEPVQSGKGDKYNLVHNVTNTQTNETFQAEFTPYCHMSKIDFENYIDLGCPPKREVRMLSSDTLRRMKNKQL